MKSILSEKDNAKCDVQVVQLLKTVSVELNALADASEHLQSMISDVLCENHAGSTAAIYKLQDLDRITQTLNALSGFIMHISEEMRPDWEIEVLAAMRTLTLADLASRLAPFHLEHDANDQCSNTAGDCSFL